MACFVEDSPGSMAALAEAMAVSSGGRLSVVHIVDVAEGAGTVEGVMPPEVEDEDAAGSWLRALVAGVPGGEAVVLRAAGAPRAACEWARDAGVDLIVVGGLRGRLDRILRGDFARHLVGHAHCSVLVARPGD